MSNESSIRFFETFSSCYLVLVPAPKREQAPDASSVTDTRIFPPFRLGYALRRGESS
jgi:hypothetical protein